MKKHKLQISENKSRTILEIISDVVIMIVVVLALSLIIFNNSNIIATIIFIMSCGYVYFKFVKKDNLS